MRRLQSCLALFACPVAALGCAGDVDDGISGEFSDDEWLVIETLAPLGLPSPDPTNRFADDSAAAAFGQRIFFEKRYSGALTLGDTGENGGLGEVGDAGLVSCASCHLPSSWFMDTRSTPNATSLGAAWTPRNAPALVNAAYYDWFGWGGKQDSLWMQGSTSHESKDNTAGNRLQYVHLLYERYREDYDALFPVPLDPALDPEAPDASRFPAAGKPKAQPSDPDGVWEMMASEDRLIVNRIISDVGKALAAYERLLVSRNAPLDRFVEGDETAMSAAARRGLRLFIGKAACVACHSTPSLSDDQFHNTGVPQMVGEHVPEADLGRYDDVVRVMTGTFNGAGAFSDDAEAGAAKLVGTAQSESQRGQFRTKSLRNVAMTAPYMHNGSMATLAEVVTFYNVGGGDAGFAGEKDPRMVPLNLTSAEESDLVAFLESLTGDPVPEALLADTSPP